MKILRIALKAALAAAALLYPFWMWQCLERFGLAPAAGLLALMAAARAAADRTRRTVVPAALAAALAAASLLWEAEAPLALYPVLMNAFFLWLFASSLSETPVVEQLARLRERTLLPEAVRWCRGVTKAWCAFFVGNGLIALATVLAGDRELWVAWNGFGSYLAMGALFAGEWLLRRRMQRRLGQARKR